MILDFDNELGKKHFEFCFVGFVLGGCVQEKKGIAILRREKALFSKLEAISELKPCGKKMVNGEPERQLVNGSKLELDAQEFEILHHYIGQVPWQSGTPVSNALETIDWLEATAKNEIPADK